MAHEKKTLADDIHRNRVSGISGRTAGKMFRVSKSTPSRSGHTLKQKNAPRPMGKNRFPLGHKYTTIDGVPIPGC